MAFMGGGSACRNRLMIFLSVLLVGLVVAIALGAALLIALLPAGDQTAVESRRLAAGVIFCRELSRTRDWPDPGP